MNTLRTIELDCVIGRPVPGQILLEIGAGTGKQAQLLSERGFQVSALDLASSNYRHERVWPITEYDGRRFPFPDRSFDLVFSSNVLEHVHDLPAMHAEIRRVLRPDGRCVHVLPTHFWRLWTTLSAFPAAIKVALRARNRRDAYRAVRSFGSAMFQPRHGEDGNVVTELFHFRPERWRRNFRANGFAVLEDRPVGLFYTGHQVMGSRLSFKIRRRLARLLGSGTHVFYLRVAEPASVPVVSSASSASLRATIRSSE